MSALSDREAIIGLKNAQLEKGHRVNTRKSYRGWVIRYRQARKDGIVRNLQGFLTYLSTLDLTCAPKVKRTCMSGFTD
jgi:hypothetical protein